MPVRRIAIALLVVALVPTLLGQLQDAISTAPPASTASFTRDTLVSTPDGLGRIDQIAAGDRVQSYDFASGSWVASQVAEVIPSYYDAIIMAYNRRSGVFEAFDHETP